MTLYLDAVSRDDQFALWQHYYNWDRVHGAHNGKTPNDRFINLISHTLFFEEVSSTFQPTSQRLQAANYNLVFGMIEIETISMSHAHYASEICPVEIS